MTRVVHWLTRYDPDDGEPYGELCDCAIGEDHNASALAELGLDTRLEPGDPQ